MANKLLLVLATCLAHAVAYSGPDLPPGPYCGTKTECCEGREDRCSHHILDTICYCDSFCSRGRQFDDCCPDYEPVCLGQKPPPEPLVKPCQHKGKFYPPSHDRKENCNTCTCVLDQWTNQTKWECTDDICIIGANVAQDVNRLHAGWRATNYTQFLGRKLKDGLIYKLGTFPVEALTKMMNPLSPPKKSIDFPPEFDARKHWPKYISAPRDQGWCGSDWAVSLATVASDRFAIQSQGAESLVLSPQMLLSCNVKGQQGCRGGHVDGAWIYVRMQGLVDEDCFPYKAVRGKCPFKKGADLTQDGCTPSVPERSERYKVSPPGRLKGERSIMADIMQSGPVQAIMTVYQDFFHYRDGIYRHTRVGNNQLNGLHSVRIIGWGEENGRKYWIVSNSWGQEWGENGYFRIARGDNESGIESFVLTALPGVAEAYQRK